MKNKIRSEIVKIANQILSEAQNFDTEQMKRQVGQLYEKLSVLAYLEIQLKGVATE